jgi:hypothetical protein
LESQKQWWEVKLGRWRQERAGLKQKSRGKLSTVLDEFARSPVTCTEAKTKS